MTVPMSRFILNTDYTSVKERASFDGTLSVPSLTLDSMGGGGSSTATRYTDITVPSGVYFENINITFSLTDDTTPAPFISYQKYLGTDGQGAPITYEVLASVVKVNATTYRIYAIINNSSPFSQVTVPAFTVRAKGHLFVSTF